MSARAADGGAPTVLTIADVSDLLHVHVKEWPGADAAVGETRVRIKSLDYNRMQRRWLPVLLLHRDHPGEPGDGYNGWSCASSNN